MIARHELKAWLAGAAAKCRAERSFGPLFRFGVAQDIAIDLDRQIATAGADAYSAQQADLEAAKLLEQAAADGLTKADLPAIAKALRLIRRSAAHDGKISDLSQ